jgi:hypothetical protein
VAVPDEHRLVEAQLLFGQGDLLRGGGLAEDDARGVAAGREVQQHERQQGDGEEQHHPRGRPSCDVADHAVRPGA